MLTLYHCIDARSFRCLWLLEEMGAEYDLQVLSFPPRLRQPDFLSFHPVGTVPYVRDGDVEMFESTAILQYLAQRESRHGFAVETHSPDYGTWLNWLHFGEASLTVPLAVSLRYASLEPRDRRNPIVAADYRDVFANRVMAVERRLEDRDYLVSSRFTVADISVGYALKLCELMGLQQLMPSRIARYWQLLQQRPAYQRAMAAQQA